MTDTAYFSHGHGRQGRWLVICDHATNHVPDFVANGDLGLAESDMRRHIAFDIGALGLARGLADMLDAPMVYTNFSRLVIDPNRGEDDPTLVMQLYDGTVIPANRNLSAAQYQERLDRLYRPYHAALAEHLNDPGINLLSVHSFTPQLKGRQARPWEVGVLSASDRRLADPLIERLRFALTSPIGDNAPYKGHLPGDSVDRHALSSGRGNILIELRQDLIADETGQMGWARFLAPHLEAARSIAGL